MTRGAAHKPLTNNCFFTKAAINLTNYLSLHTSEYRCAAVCEFSLTTIRNHLGYE